MGSAEWQHEHALTLYVLDLTPGGGTPSKSGWVCAADNFILYPILILSLVEKAPFFNPVLETYNDNFK